MNLSEEIRLKGMRGGTYLTDEWLDGMCQKIRDINNKVDNLTLIAVEYVAICQEKAESYDWLEYMDQMPKIEKLYVRVKDELIKRGIPFKELWGGRGIFFQTLNKCDDM